MLAVAIVAIALITLIGVMTFGMQMLTRSKEVSVSTEMARRVLEKIRQNVRLAGFDYLPTGSYTFDGRIPNPQTGAAPLQFPPVPYPGQTIDSGNYRVVVTGNQPDPRLKAVTVEVYWDATHKLGLTTRFHP